MPSLRSLLLVGLPLASICAASPYQRSEPEAEDADLMSLNDIVNLLPAESINSALHNNLSPKYREGVFEHGKKAIEAVHQNDPELATRLVDAALHEQIGKQDLRKRQNGNDNATTTVLTTTSSEVVTRSSTTVTQVTTDTSTVVTSDTGGGQSATPGNGGGTTSEGGSGSGTTSDSGSGTVTDGGSGGGGGGTTSDSGNGGGGSGTTSDGGNNNPGSATETGVIVPVTQTTTDDNGNTVTSTTSAFQASAPTTAVVAVTTTNAQGNQVTRSETVPAAIVTTTNRQGETITSASPLTTVKVHQGTIVGGGGNGNGNGDDDTYTTTDGKGNSVVLSGTRAGQVITTTDSSGRTVVLTYHPNGGEVSQLVLKTTNLPGGGQSTITSFAVVGAPTAGSDNNSKGKPGLQGAAAPTGKYIGQVAAVVGGAVGVAAVLL